MENFVLDNIKNITRVGDKIVFLFDTDTESKRLCVAKVMDLRVEKGNYEVNAGGPYGGWKKEFYRVLKREEVPEDE